MSLVKNINNLFIHSYPLPNLHTVPWSVVQRVHHTWCNHHHLCQNIWMPWSRIPYLKAFPFSWCHKNHYMIYCLQWKSQKGCKYTENTYAHYIYRSFDFWWLKGPPSRELYHTLMANIRVLIKCRQPAKKPATWRLEPSTFWGNRVKLESESLKLPTASSGTKPPTLTS